MYSKALIFGPVYNKYFEAVELVETKGAISVDNPLQLEKVLDQLLKKDSNYYKISEAAGAYVYSKKGSTEKIVNFIQEKRLLTN